MRRLAPLVVLALLLAGCARPAAEVDAADAPAPDANVTLVARPALENATPTPAPLLAPPPERIPFLPPVALPLVGDIGGGEPNIAILPDGTLFVTAPTGLQGKPNAVEGAAYLWRSTDGGATWDTLRAPDPGPATGFCSCDADVVASPDGWVYVSDWWNGNYLVERSSDGGETWEAAPVTTREAFPLTRVDRQWLVAGEDGFVGLFYAHFAPVRTPLDVVTDLHTGVHAVFSADHGATWGEPVVVVTREQGKTTQIAHPRMLPDGTLVMPYGETTIDADKTSWRSPSEVKLAVSTDGGATWDHRAVADAPEGFDNLWAVQADVDPMTGAIHVAWGARIDDDRMGLFVATSRDAGETWTEPLALRDAGLHFLPWVATSADGRVAVGWYGGDATGDATEAEDAAWFAYVAQSGDGGDSFLVQRVSDEPVKEGPMCPRGAACDGDRELLDYVSLAYAPDGALHYAYARSEGGVAQTLFTRSLPDAAP